MPDLTSDEALAAINQLRCNVISLQNAGWSNTMYPLAAILNAAGFEYIEPNEDDKAAHLDCYGGAGGYPGNLLREPMVHSPLAVSRTQSLEEAIRWVLDDPSDKNLSVLKARLENA